MWFCTTGARRKYNQQQTFTTRQFGATFFYNGLRKKENLV